MKDWKKRRMKRASEIAHIADDEPPNTYSDFSMGWNEGRTDTLSELAFVRDALERLSKYLAYNGDDWVQKNAREALSRLDALTGDVEK